MSSILTCWLDFFFFFLRNWLYLWFHFYLLNAMTDGRFFSQLSCQETQKAWMHHRNGEIRPGRHPRQIWEPFPKFHEDSGQSWWCLFSGRLNRGNETKTDPQKKLPPWYHQLLNLGMDAIVAMALLFQNLKIDLEGFFRGGGGEHLEDHLVNLGGREQHWPWCPCSARLVLTGKATMTVHPVSLR